MAITHVDDGDSGFLGYYIAPGAPTGIATGDLMFAATCATDESEAVFYLNGTGWTAFASHIYTGQNQRVQLWWKFAEDSTPLIPQWDDTGHDGGGITFIGAFRSDGTWAADPIAVVGSWTESTTPGTVQTIAGITTTADGQMVVGLFALRGYGSCDPSAQSSPFTGRTTNHGNSNGRAGSNAYAYGVQSTAGATGSMSITTSGPTGTCSSLTVAFALTEDSGPADIEASATGTDADTGAVTTALELAATVSATDVDTGSLSADLQISVSASGTDSDTSSVTVRSGRDFTRLSQVSAIKASIVGDATPSLLVDDRYKGSYDWNPSSGDEAAIDLGADASRTHILVHLSAEEYGTGEIGAGGLANIQFAGSADSTNGVNGTWVNLSPSPSSYAYQHWCRVIPFSGYRWLRMTIGAGVGAIDEWDIWDATELQRRHVVGFVGDSITVRAMKRGDQSGVGNQPSFQRVMETLTGEYPAQIGCAKVGEGVDWGDDNIDAFMIAFPDAHRWCIGLGTNGAAAGSSGLASFEAGLEGLFDKIIAAGHEPMVARIPWTANGSYGGGTFGSDNTALYNASIDSIVATYGLAEGPDLYTLAHDNEADYYDEADGGDGVHPGVKGCRLWLAAWADAVAAAQAADVQDIRVTVDGADVDVGYAPTPSEVFAEASGTDSDTSSVTVTNDQAASVSATDADTSAVTVANDFSQTVAGTDADTCSPTWAMDLEALASASDADTGSASTTTEVVGTASGTDADTSAVEITADMNYPASASATDADSGSVTWSMDLALAVSATDADSGTASTTSYTEVSLAADDADTGSAGITSDFEYPAAVSATDSDSGTAAWSLDYEIALSVTDVDTAAVTTAGDLIMCTISTSQPLLDAGGNPFTGTIYFAAETPQVVQGSVITDAPIAVSVVDGHFSVDLVAGASVATLARLSGYVGGTYRTVPVASTQDFATWE